MEGETRYIPESEKRPRMSLRDVFDAVKNNLREATWDFYDSKQPDPEISAEIKKLEDGKHYGQMAHLFMSDLIPRSGRERDKVYQILDEQKGSKAIAQSDYAIDMSMLHLAEPGFGFTREEYEENKDRILSKKRGEVEGNVQESDRQDGSKVQQVFNKYKREGSNSFIEEQVINLLKSDVNSSVSTLALVTDKARLHLSDLLPDGYSLTPEEMNQYDLKFDETLGKAVSIPIPKDLRDYRGTRSSEGRFYESPGRKAIAYGNVVKKGGILSLLHETAHAWQDTYFNSDFGKPNFENLHKKVFLEISCMKDLLEENKYERSAVISLAQRELDKLGVEIDPENFVAGDQEIGEGQVKIGKSWSDEKFIVKTDKFDALIADYEKQERDAWAHAIRTMRFLRKFGVDVEPEMKDLKSIKEFINPCLESYQKDTEKIIESSTKKVRFAK